MALGRIIEGYYTLYPDLRPPGNKWDEAIEDAQAIGAGVRQVMADQPPRASRHLRRDVHRPRPAVDGGRRSAGP